MQENKNSITPSGTKVKREAICYSVPLGHMQIVPEWASTSHVHSAFVFPYILTTEYPTLLLGNKILAATHDLFQILNF
jgi:hypothetical protein